MSHSFSIREVERRHLDRGPIIIKGDKMFAAACKLGLEGIVSKKLDAPYKSGPSKAWPKIKNPKAPAATRAVDGTF
jgi:ATP-dependent DNA ligase